MLRRILLGLAAVLAVLLVLGLFLPKSAHVERSIVSSASPPRVFELANGFGRFNEWSPWADLDPDTKYEFTGPSTGVGAKMAWRSEDSSVGVGSQEIVAVDPGRSVSTRLDFGAEGKADTILSVVPEGTGSRITWSMDSNFEDDYLGRYFGVFLDYLVGRDYEKGLARLKSLAESGS